MTKYRPLCLELAVEELVSKHWSHHRHNDWFPRWFFCRLALWILDCFTTSLHIPNCRQFLPAIKAVHGTVYAVLKCHLTKLAVLQLKYADNKHERVEILRNFQVLMIKSWRPQRDWREFQTLSQWPLKIYQEFQPVTLARAHNALLLSQNALDL